MPAAVLSFPKRATAAEFLLLELVCPNLKRTPLGVLLLTGDSLEFKLRDDYSSLGLSEDDQEYLEALTADFSAQIAERGAHNFLREMEESLSNFLVVSAREPAGASTLEQLYERLVDTRVRPYVTHLPVYTLKAAATKFGEDAEVSESDWRRVEGLRLSEGMFIAQVVGRSMEPLIPDGSYCVFRSPVVGSRQNKKLLIELFGTTETSARYTVKRYSSEKVQSSEDEWEHSRIRLIPLNPEFPAFDLEDGTFRVIGEFVRVLQD